MHSNNYTLKSKWEGLSYPIAFVVRLWAQPQPPMAPWNLPRGNKCEETGFALDITQPWEQLESLGFLGLEGRGGRRGCWVRKRERRRRDPPCFWFRTKITAATLARNMQSVEIRKSILNTKFILKYLNLASCAPRYMYIFESRMEKMRSKAFVVKILPVLLAPPMILPHWNIFLCCWHFPYEALVFVFTTDSWWQ